MRITDLLKKEAMILNASVKTRAEAIDSLVDLHKSVGNISDTKVFKEKIYEREESGTTAVGDGIAIPHAKSKEVLRPGLALITVPKGMDYGSMDGKPSTIIFMIAAPVDGDVHIEVLSRLTVLLMDANLRNAILSADSKEKVLSLIDAKESEKFPSAAQGSQKDNKVSTHSNKKIVAVTACPTGIAHTFMAAEALEAKGRELGYDVKAETNGSGGVKNALTAKDIREAEGVIIAADTNVEMARFDGKKVVIVKVADGIHKPEKLIRQIIDGDANIYHHIGAKIDQADSEGKEGIGRQIYKHLMSGVSHMLPFVVGGGILIALSFLLDDYSLGPETFGSNTPIAAFFNKLGGYAFGFMLPILAGFIAMSIADRPGLAVGFVGGSLASVGMTFANPGGDVPAGFLGALIAGFAAGYIVLFLRKICSYLPDKLEGIKPVLIYPLIGILLIGVFMCLINPLVAMLNTALTNGLNSLGTGSKIILGAVLGGMMSIDMGGPFNKAAYVFGTMAISEGNYDIMAAVMIGGMIPPIAIALATTFFKNRFTDDERKSGVVNYIMGLCFITEGAIPFAASDPARVLPSCIIGSATAGALSMAFGCTLMAPHGGLLVLPVIGNAGFYALSLLIGSLVGMILLAILKKPIRHTV